MVAKRSVKQPGDDLSFGCHVGDASFEKNNDLNKNQFLRFGERLDEIFCCTSCRSSKEQAFLDLEYLLIPRSSRDAEVLPTQPRIYYSFMYALTLPSWQI